MNDENASSSNWPGDSPAPLWAACISLTAGAPVLAGLLIYAVYPEPWNRHLLYGGVTIAVFLAFVCVSVVSLGIERTLRHRYRLGLQRFPWLSAATCAAPLVGWLAGQAVHAVMIGQPEWCAFHQVVAWNTQRGDRLTLALEGRGNAAKPTYESAELSSWSDRSDPWTPERPGRVRAVPSPFSTSSRSSYRLLATFEFHKLKATGPARAGISDPTVSAAALQATLAPLDLPEAESALLSADVLAVLSAAEESRPLVAASGTVEPLRVRPAELPRTYADAWAWLGAMAVVYLIVGQISLYGPSESTTGKRDLSRQDYLWNIRMYGMRALALFALAIALAKLFLK